MPVVSMPNEISPEFRLKIPHPPLLSAVRTEISSPGSLIDDVRSLVGPRGHGFFLDFALPSDAAESSAAVRRRVLDVAESDGNAAASDGGVASDRGSRPARRRSLSR